MASKPTLTVSLYAAIALAAALGGGMRFGVSIAWLQWGNDGWPWPTLVVNLLGSFLIAVYWRLAGSGGRYKASLERRTAVMTGFCGGLTTFSMFGVETLVMLDQGQWGGAIVYLIVTGVGAPAAAWLGLQDFRHGTPRAE